ncbi:MAG: hypothetical protein GY771_15220 [bacterium]|nr:hypothetical protein [bacterium]
MRRILLISISLAVLLGVACKETIGPGPESDPDYTSDTPEECIYNLEYSFDNTDIGLYEAVLSRDFTFYFNPSDVGRDVDGYIIPDSWSYEEDWAATNNMYNNAYSIDLNLAEERVGNPPFGVTEYTAPNI